MAHFRKNDVFSVPSAIVSTTCTSQPFKNSTYDWVVVRMVYSVFDSGTVSEYFDTCGFVLAALCLGHDCGFQPHVDHFIKV